MSESPQLTVLGAIGLPLAALAAGLVGFFGTVQALHTFWPVVGIVPYLDHGLAALALGLLAYVLWRHRARWWLVAASAGLAAGACVAAVIFRGFVSI